MKIDQSKLNRQKNCLRSWRSNAYKGTVVAATGFGKTFIGIMAMQEMAKTISVNARTVIVVPTDYLRTQWREQLESFKLTDYARVDTINSWLNYDGKISTDLVIYDEVHNYPGGDVFHTIFEKIDCKRRLGLTAKERDKDLDSKILNRYAPIVARVPLSECLKRGWVAPFDVFNWGIELPAKDRKTYDDMHNKFVKYFSTFDFKLNLMFLAMRDEDYRKELASEYRWDPKIIMVHATQANRIMQQRKKWLYSHRLIFEGACEAIRKLEGRKIITFSEVTSMADKLGEAFPDSVVYHTSLPTKVYASNGKLVAVAVKVDGKTRYKTVSGGDVFTWKGLKDQYKGSLTRVSGDRQKDNALEAFKNGDTDIIHSATALNEGVDIPHIDASIKTSFNSTIIDSIQRTGRAARIVDGVDKRALEINLYLKGTQSERWLRKSQKETPNVKWVDSLEDIL